MATYTFTTIDSPLFSGSSTYAGGVNDAGEVVGFSQISPYSFGFLYDDGEYTPIQYNVDGFNLGFTAPHDINNSGQVVGTVDFYFHTFSFLYSDGVYTTIQDPLGSYTQAEGINDAGQIVGNFIGSGDLSATHGFLYSSGSYTTIDDPLATNATYAVGINNTGQIVGSYLDGIGSHGFLDTGGTYVTLDDPLAVAGTTVASGINNAGQIVGSYWDGTTEHGFLYDGTNYTTVDDSLGVNGTWTTGINNSGQIVGYYLDGSNVAHGFLTNPVVPGQTLVGGNGKNTLTGAAGDDIIFGGNAKDILNGGAGDDVISGGNGDDILNGGAGNDTLTGGYGKDTFIFDANFGEDIVTDFKVTFETVQLDHTQFADFAAVQAHAVQTGADTVITYGAADTITLQGVALSDLHASNFLFT